MADAQERLRRHITKLVTTSVIRGSVRGETHGGICVLDLEAQSVLRTYDRDDSDIDWTSASGGRGLRGIAVDGDTVYVATGAELLAMTPEFSVVDTWRCPFLLDAHGVFVWERMLYMTSAVYDSIVGFDLDQRRFVWGMNIVRKSNQFAVSGFDPNANEGPLPLDKLHINNVHCNRHGMYITGLKTGGMLHFNGTRIRMAVELPANARNAQPYRDGVLFNDSDAGALRYTGRGDGREDRAMRVPERSAAELENSDAIEQGIVRSGFARGLCVLSGHIVAGGSSPSTVTLYDLAANETLGSVHIAQDARESLHSIARWPFD